MSTTPRHASSARARTVELRLSHVLDTAPLARVVPHLAPETLHRLVQLRGLEACGELVTAATPAQLTALLDLALWPMTQPGRAAMLDVDRFGEWLEVLIDTGTSIAARTVAALDPALVVAGLSRYLRVFDPGTFEPTAQHDDEAIDWRERMPGDTVRHVEECEVGGFVVRALRHDAWDAIVQLLTAMEVERPDAFSAVMHGCRRLSNSRPEIESLDDLPLAPEQHLIDVALAREQRHERLGYVGPADARAFLALARQPTAGPVSAASAMAGTYLRQLDDDPPTEADGVADPFAAATAEAIVALMAESGVAPIGARRRLVSGGTGDTRTATPLLTRLLEHVARADARAFLARGRELAFLANVLQAGAAVQSRTLTPTEAADAAAATCNLGLESLADPPRDTHLVAQGLVPVFEAGWARLHRDVGLATADRLLAVLHDFSCDDPDLTADLQVFERRLAVSRADGTPWRARDGADVLATLDPTAWVSVLGLLDECPTIPAALSAVLERRTTAVSPTAFAFIARAAQLGDVRVFLRMLPTVLAR